MGLKLVIFDLDGTLVNSDPTVLSIINNIRKKRGLKPVDYIQAKNSLAKGGEALIKDLITIKDIPKVLKEFRKDYLGASLMTEKLFPKAKEYLDYLKSKRYFLALLTNKPKILTKKVLAHHDIDKYFDFIVTGCDVDKKKPNPEGLQKILKHFNLKNSQSIFIGDNIIDYQASEKAGINFFLYDNKIEHLSFSNNDNCFKFDSYEDLFKVNL